MLSLKWFLLKMERKKLAGKKLTENGITLTNMELWKQAGYP